MKKEDWNKTWKELLSKYSSKPYGTAASQTITDAYAERMRNDLWDLVEKEITEKKSIDEISFTKFIKQINRKYESDYDKAIAIIKYIGFEDL